MSSFTTSLVVSPLVDGHRWRLENSFIYHVGTKYSKNKIVVPKGFITDFASVPFLFWSILPPFGKYTKSTVLHDWLYHSHERSRLESDAIFYEAMTVEGVVPWKASVMYGAVRVFGWLSWRAKCEIWDDKPLANWQSILPNVPFDKITEEKKP